ncbi:DUF1700 domain-containing protein [Mycoplasmatota bacterium]|nr:DUF1700 domain-containing protein [Mycoplasmatota bacterium]
MNKEKYIIELRKRLSLLDPKEVEDIVVEYLDYIKQKQNEEISEGLALEQLGNVNDLAKKILKSYKISDRYINLFIGKEKVIDEINDFVEKLADVSTTVYSKIEESVSEFAKTTGHFAKNVFKETRKFGEEKINEVKNIIKNTNKTNETTTESDDTDDTDYEIIE